MKNILKYENKNFKLSSFENEEIIIKNQIKKHYQISNFQAIKFLKCFIFYFFFILNKILLSVLVYINIFIHNIHTNSLNNSIKKICHKTSNTSQKY